MSEKVMMSKHEVPDIEFKCARCYQLQVPCEYNGFRLFSLSLGYHGRACDRCASVTSPFNTVKGICEEEGPKYRVMVDGPIRKLPESPEAGPSGLDVEKSVHLVQELVRGPQISAHPLNTAYEDNLSVSPAHPPIRALEPLGLPNPWNSGQALLTPVTSYDGVNSKAGAKQYAASDDDEKADMNENNKELKSKHSFVKTMESDHETLKNMADEVEDLKDQVKIFKGRASEADHLRTEISALKKQIAAFDALEIQDVLSQNQAAVGALLKEVISLKGTALEMEAMREEIGDLRQKASEAEALRKEIEVLKSKVEKREESKEIDNPRSKAVEANAREQQDGKTEKLGLAVHQAALVSDSLVNIEISKSENPLDVRPAPTRSQDNSDEAGEKAIAADDVEVQQSSQDPVNVAKEPVSTPAATRNSRILSGHGLATPENWQWIRSLVDGDLKYHLSFQRLHLTWTVNLNTIPTDLITSIPLYIAGRPVIVAHLDSDWHYSEGGEADPLANTPIDPRKELPLEQVELIFKTFPSAVDAIVLFNGTLMLSYETEFNPHIKRSSSPATFGGLNVEFVYAENIMTADPRINNGDAMFEDSPEHPPEVNSEENSNSESEAEFDTNTLPDLDPWWNRIYVSLPEGDPRRIPTGSLTNLWMRKGGMHYSKFLSLGLLLRDRPHAREGNRARLAVTMATHVLLGAVQNTQLLNTNTPSATVEHIKGIFLTKPSPSHTNIGQVGRSFDEPETDGYRIPYVYDVTLLEAYPWYPGSEDQLPELFFTEDGVKKAKLEWLEEPMQVLNHQCADKVVLLGSNKFARKQVGEKRKPADAGDDDDIGTRRTHGNIEFGRDELERILQVHEEKPIEEVERSPSNQSIPEDTPDKSLISAHLLSFRSSLVGISNFPTCLRESAVVDVLRFFCVCPDLTIHSKMETEPGRCFIVCKFPSETLAMLATDRLNGTEIDAILKPLGYRSGYGLPKQQHKISEADNNTNPTVSRSDKTSSSGSNEGNASENPPQSSSSADTTIHPSQGHWEPAIPANELEILVQGVRYSCRKKLSRAIIWRPDLTRYSKQELVDMEFSSGCPLAIKSKENSFRPIYKVFGFQMMQKLVKRDEMETAEISKEEKFKLYLSGNFGCYGASSVVSTELTENWEIWDRMGEQESDSRDTIQPPSLDEKGKATHHQKDVNARKRIKISFSSQSRSDTKEPLGTPPRTLKRWTSPTGWLLGPFHKAPE